MEPLTVPTTPEPYVPPVYLEEFDSLHNNILSRAIHGLSEEEKSTRHDVLTAVVLLRNPLSMAGIASLLDNTKANRGFLSTFGPAINVPSDDNSPVHIVHNSFLSFILDTERCGENNNIDYTQGHQMLAVKCLQLLNTSLRRNICGLPDDYIGIGPREIPNPSPISEALQYSSLNWGFHLLRAFPYPRSPEQVLPSILLDPLRTFAEEQLLHWFECLSALGELKSGTESLRQVYEAFSYTKIDPWYALAFKDAFRCLEMGFEPINLHCLSTYRSAFAWIPEQSWLRQQYSTSFANIRILRLKARRD